VVDPPYPHTISALCLTSYPCHRIQACLVTLSIFLSLPTQCVP
jgi:hypothetical protein